MILGILNIEDSQIKLPTQVFPLTPAILIITYNRPHSLERLLASIQNARYSFNPISLIISIDFSASELHSQVVSIAKNFQWEHGSKEIVEHSSNLGLKRHVLTCGDLTGKYGAVIALEDDLLVSPFYFDYSVQAIKKYSGDSRIAGISLYSCDWSQVAARSFVPMQSGYDTYFCQNAQSWGQIWTADMWSKFKNWHDKHSNSKISETLPDNVQKWSEQSWLRYHNWYCQETEKFFVYPHISLSTNYSEKGVHLKGDTTYFQVPLLMGRISEYRFQDLNIDALKYDVFFERIGLEKFLGIDSNSICIDLYGSKMNRENKRYWLTTKVEQYQMIRSWGLELRPHELNIIWNVSGDQIFLYDTTKNVKQRANLTYLTVKSTLYDIKEVPSSKLLKVVLHRVRKRLKNFYKK